MIEADPVLSQFLSAFLCMGLFTSSRIAEQVRAGITSIPSGLPYAAKALGWKVATPIFNGATESDIQECLKMAGLAREVGYDCLLYTSPSPRDCS